MSGAQNLLLGNFSTAVAGYQIERSLRFNSADSAYLSRTFTTPTNAKKFTISAWVKVTQPLGTLLDFGLLCGPNSAEVIGISGTGAFGASVAGKFFIRFGDTNLVYYPQLFRDVSAWAHIVVAIDTDQATQSDRAKFYYNGVLQTATSSTITSGYSPALNTAATRYIGGLSTNAGYYANGYLAEYNFIDGQVPTTTTRTVNGITETILTQLGEFNSSTGVWTPKAWGGTYGNNGFYVNFSDNSNTTAATLGKDSSGNGNNWTPNNFSVTAGVGNDSLVDSPTSYGSDTGVGGEVRGNYCTLNPLQYSSTYVTLSNGNLNVTGSSGADAGGAFATAKVNSGKWYWEATIVAVSGTYPFIGFAVNTTGTQYQGGARIGTAGTFAIVSPESFITLNGSPSGTSFTTNDVLQFALDMDNGKMWVGKNGTWMNSGAPASGTGNPFSISDKTQFVSPFIFSYNSSQVAYNFGQRAFAYTAPSGFKALCTQNLTYTHTIGATSTTQAGKYFNPILWTGDGANPRSFTGVGFQPDFVWIKSRSNAYSHRLADAVRGVGKELFSDSTSTEVVNNNNGSVQAFNSDGFTLSGSTSTSDVNGSGLTFVAWNWNAGGSNQTISVGQYATSPANVPSIASTVRANTTSGFSIVTYNGNDLAAATVGHGLGTTPSMIIVKTRTFSAGWNVYHRSLSASNGILLNATNGQFAASTTTGGIINTSPTNNTFGFTAGTSNVNNVNANGHTYVAYCFAEVPGYSAFGSYTGNGSSTDGVFIYLGFRPRYVLIKRTNTTENWHVMDTSRNSYNAMDASLYPNLANSEVPTSGHAIDFLSNGIKMRNNNTGYNTSSSTYIYAAFAESPFKFSLAR